MIVILEKKFRAEFTENELRALKTLLDAVTRTDAPDYLNDGQQEMVCQIHHAIGVALDASR